MKKFELMPTDNKKSFYGKCYVIEDGQQAILYSYDRIIEIYNYITETVEKTAYYNFSLTTKRHQKAFETLYGIQH